jgi:arylsulfatase
MNKRIHFLSSRIAFTELAPRVLKKVQPVVSLLFFIVLLSCSGSPKKQVEALRPNILVLVADDLGYSDLGCFGGEIKTPSIDSLAMNGIRFSRFHTAPMCAPSRAMLLTGNDHHIAGVGRQALQADVFGYEGHITNRVASLPDLLSENDYHTYMAGKWHLGGMPKDNPHQLGFERSFVMLEGVGGHFNAQGIFGDNSRSHYTEDGNEAQWPDGKFSTDVYTDKLLGFIDEHSQDQKPFFAYAAYTAPHWPLQVEEKYRKKYEGAYAEGYEVLREARFKTLKDIGLIPELAVLPPLHPSIKPWNSLTEEEKLRESRKMELYAGMVDNLDTNIGKIIQHLKDIGVYKNTLIVFISDNGAAGEDYYGDADIRPYINNYYNDDLETMGEPNSFISYGPPWAEAGTAAFKYYKEYTTDGGIMAPMILSGALIKNTNTVNDAFVSIMDIAPTIYELGGIAYPKEWKGNIVYPLRGSSLVPIVFGSSFSVHSDSYIFALEHTGYTMLQKGHWKITNSERPFNEANFELFDLSKDLGENHDLKKSSPEKYRELLRDWDAFSREVRLQLPR